MVVREQEVCQAVGQGAEEDLAFNTEQQDQSLPLLQYPNPPQQIPTASYVLRKIKKLTVI